MNVWSLRVTENYYEALLKGQKTVEARAPDDEGEKNYDKIEEGDILEIWSEGREEILFMVEEKNYYHDARDLLQDQGVKSVVPKANALEEGVEICREVYPQRIDDHGIYGFELGRSIFPH